MNYIIRLIKNNPKKQIINKTKKAQFSLCFNVAEGLKRKTICLILQIVKANGYCCANVNLT